jgi:hypothetical protein
MSASNVLDGIVWEGIRQVMQARMHRRRDRVMLSRRSTMRISASRLPQIQVFTSHKLSMACVVLPLRLWKGLSQGIMITIPILSG